jgi:hypothetical protein
MGGDLSPFVGLGVVSMPRRKITAVIGSNKALGAL